MANKYSKQIEDTIEKNKQKYIDPVSYTHLTLPTNSLV